MTTTISRSWTLEETLPGGLRIFRLDDGRRAFADESGVQPDLTNNGALFPDTTREIQILADGLISVPVTPAVGEGEQIVPYAIPVSFGAALRIIDLGIFPAIVSDGRRYGVAEIASSAR